MELLVDGGRMCDSVVVGVVNLGCCVLLPRGSGGDCCGGAVERISEAAAFDASLAEPSICDPVLDSAACDDAGASIDDSDDVDAGDDVSAAVVSFAACACVCGDAVGNK